MEHIGAQTCQLQHFVKRNFRKLLRVGNNPRVGGVNPVHVGVNFAQIRMARRGQRHGRRVRPAAAQSGNVVIFIQALKARNNHNALFVKLGRQPLCVNLFNSAGRIVRVCGNAGLPPGEGNHRKSHAFNGHG